MIDSAPQTLRAFADDDAEPVEQLLQALWGHDPTMHSVYRFHRVWPAHAGLIRKSLVASRDGTMCGVGTIFESTLHPARLFLVINVASTWQRQGVGSVLYDALTALGDGRPWLVKATRRDAAGWSFLTRRGYCPLVTTRLGVPDPSLPAVQAWMATLPREVAGYRICQFDEHPDDAELTTVAQVHAAVYRQFHQWNPPVAESDERALAHYCGPTVLAGSHLCVYQGDRLVGAANLFRDPARPTAAEGYLVHLGVIAHDSQDDQLLTAALIRRCLEWAETNGLRVRFEADDTYVPHRAVLAAAPADERDDDFVLFGSPAPGTTTAPD